jgi:hypothetical protein
MQAQAATKLRVIEAPLNYLAADSETPFVYAYEAPPGMPQRQGRYEAQTVAIADARPIAGELSLDREGFLLRRAPTAVRDLYDDPEVKSVYYPEIERLVQAETGAEKVVIFDHTVRNTAIGKPGRGVREPAITVHNDYTQKSGPQRVRDVLPPEEAEARLQRRFIQVNVWRPIVGPVQSWPLALCDARTLELKDFVASERRFPDRIGEIYAVKYNPHHRWFYFPQMAREEVVYIKCFDSARVGGPRFSAHSAFVDPTTPAGAPARESIEVRTLAFF